MSVFTAKSAILSEKPIIEIKKNKTGFRSGQPLLNPVLFFRLSRTKVQRIKDQVVMA
jgi:hypothetical protein